MSSFMKRLTEDQRKFIEKLMREDSLTLNEMLDEIRAEFPAESIPSRSALGRAKKNYSSHAKRMREVQFATEALVSELGEDKDDKAGAFMVQGITTLINNLVLDRLSDDDENPDATVEFGIKDALSLAKASKELMQARGLSTKQRLEVEAIARQRLQAEQAENLEKVAASQGMGKDQIQFWREKVLGIK